MILDIVVPVRNPTAVFQKTVQSLVNQTDRTFSVLISDNFSSSGTEFIDEAMTVLREANVPVRKIQPPGELGRVEHWNWAHAQSAGDWLKPLFSGDWLETAYLSQCRRVMSEVPAVQFIACYASYHYPSRTKLENCAGLSGLVDPRLVVKISLSQGNFWGAPVNILYHRIAFSAMGGYNPALPICADFDLYCRIALHYPTYIIPVALANFHLHPDRFTSVGLGARTRRQSITIETLAVAWNLSYLSFCRGYSRYPLELIYRFICAAGMILRVLPRKIWQKIGG